MAAWAVVQPLPHDGAGVLFTGLVAGLAYVAVNNMLLTIVWMLHEGRSPISLYRERLATGVPHELAYGPMAMLLLVEREMGTMALALIAIPAAAISIGQAQATRAAARSVTELGGRTPAAQDDAVHRRVAGADDRGPRPVHRRAHQR